MKRRTVLQILSAFFISFFGRFRRLGELGPIARLRGIPTRPRGKISPKAAWFSPASYEALPTPTVESQDRLLALIQKGATLPPPTRSKRNRGAPTPFVFRTDPTYTPEPQEGVEVMCLKNPPVRHGVMGAAPVPPPQYVVPKGPSGVSAGAWEPLKRFRPIQPHMEAAGALVGVLSNPAASPRVDISNDTEYRAITGKRYTPFSELPAPSEEDQQLLAESRSRINSNFDELVANWDTQQSRFDQEVVNRDEIQAQKETNPILELLYPPNPYIKS